MFTSGNRHAMTSMSLFYEPQIDCQSEEALLLDPERKMLWKWKRRFKEHILHTDRYSLLNQYRRTSEEMNNGLNYAERTKKTQFRSGIRAVKPNEGPNMSLYHPDRERLILLTGGLWHCACLTHMDPFNTRDFFNDSLCSSLSNTRTIPRLLHVRLLLSPLYIAESWRIWQSTTKLRQLQTQKTQPSVAQ